MRRRNNDTVRRRDNATVIRRDNATVRRRRETRGDGYGDTAKTAQRRAQALRA